MNCQVIVAFLVLRTYPEDPSRYARYVRYSLITLHFNANHCLLRTPTCYYNSVAILSLLLTLHLAADVVEWKLGKLHMQLVKPHYQYPHRAFISTYLLQPRCDRYFYNQAQVTPCRIGTFILLCTE